jgi:hypothetical protein
MTTATRKASVKTAPTAVKTPARVESIAEAEARIQAEWEEVQRRKLGAAIEARNAGRRILPPDGMHSFTFHQGCGQPHVFTGEPIACDLCALVVEQMEPMERISDMTLRNDFVSPIPLEKAKFEGNFQAVEEIERRAAEWKASQVRASWRLVA